MMSEPRPPHGDSAGGRKVAGSNPVAPTERNRRFSGVLCIEVTSARPRRGPIGVQFLTSCRASRTVRAPFRAVSRRRRAHWLWARRSRVRVPSLTPRNPACGAVSRAGRSPWSREWVSVPLSPKLVGASAESDRQATARQRMLGPPLRAASSDRVTQHCHLTLLRGRDRFELHRRAAGAFEEADAVADEDRGDVHDDLVE